MGLPIYLAMTAAEIASTAPLPEHLAYMACHFSPYSTGLSNLPQKLPEGSMLILNDRTPIGGHDPERIAWQLAETVERFQCSAVLLDLQRPDNPETSALCRHLTDTLPCAVGVSDLYASRLPCPVFLPPVPPDVPLSEHIAPWQGREIWLEAALESMRITVTKDGTTTAATPYTLPEENAFHDAQLNCRYTIEDTPDAIHFHLTRTPEDLTALLQQAEALSITHSIGLHQQLGQHYFAG